MKFLLAVAAVIAVASAGPVHRDFITPGIAGPTPVVDENGSPIAIGPAMLELQPSPVSVGPAIVGPSPVSVGPAIVGPSPVSVGPAIVGSNPISVGPAIVGPSPVSVGPAIVGPNPISVGPAIVDFPLPDGGVVVEEPTIITPSPAVVPAADSVPIVQIIVNVNGQASSPITVSPAAVDEAVEEVHVPGPVNVVDNVVVGPSPIQVVEPVVVSPVQVAEPIIAEPVQIAEPIIVEPVQIAAPIVPSPAVILPDILN